MCFFTVKFLTLRIHVLSQFEGVRVGQVGVGGSDGKDEAALTADELHDHVSDLLLDVWRLVSHGHLGDPRQIDQRQVQHCTDERRSSIQFISQLRVFSVSAV